MSKAWLGGGVRFLQDEEDIEEVYESIKRSILMHKNTADKLREKVNELESEAYKDKELAKMQEELNEMREAYYRGFPISEAESKAITEWQNNHDKTEHNNPSQYHGTCGGGYVYEFYPTAIGTAGSCVCNICRRKANQAASLSGWKYKSEEYRKYMKEHNGEFEFQELG